MLFFKVPVNPDKYRVSSPFGWRWLTIAGVIPNPTKMFHNGEDRATPGGTEVCPAYPGYVSRVWTGVLSGLSLELTHPTCSADGLTVKTVYYHLSEVKAVMLRWVDMNEAIALTGNSGKWTTGPHLHWSVMVNNRYIDPRITYQHIVDPDDNNQKQEGGEI